VVGEVEDFLDVISFLYEESVPNFSVFDHSQRGVPWKVFWVEKSPRGFQK
jgi:hypothetical protein